MDDTPTSQLDTAFADPSVEAPQDVPFSREAELIDFLSDADATCPLCDYNLRGLTRTTCPECGTGLALMVQPAEPYLAAWITMLVLASINAGFAFLIGLIAAIGQGPPSDFFEGWSLLSMFIFGLSVPYLAVLLWARRRIAALMPARQWALAIACGTPLVLGPAIFLMHLFP